MSPAKDKDSSHRKGKKVATDDPHAKAVGEETPLSESDHSGEDERGHDLTSECPPLIDPLHDTHIHFPIVPSDHLPPPSGRVALYLLP